MNPTMALKWFTTSGIRAVNAFRQMKLLVNSHPGQVHMSVLIALCAAVIIIGLVLIRALKVSKDIRRIKENRSRLNSYDRKKIRGMNLKSTGITALLVLAVLAVGYALIRFVVPMVSRESLPFARSLYDRVADYELFKKITLSFLVAIVVPIVALWIWSVSRRVGKKGGRVVWTLITLALLVMFGRGIYIGTKIVGEAEPGVEYSANEMLKTANRYFERGDYASSEELYRTLYARGEYTRMSDADVLNNLALAQLWQAKYEDGLATMRRVFDSEYANANHVVNLLVAAQVNDIPSGTILRETGADRFVSAAQIEGEEAGAHANQRNAIAYNIAYMDMELDDDSLADGTQLSELFPQEATGDALPGWKTAEQRNDEIEEALNEMKLENDRAKRKDADIDALIEYYDALINGGQRQSAES